MKQVDISLNFGFKSNMKTNRNMVSIDKDDLYGILLETIAVDGCID